MNNWDKPTKEQVKTITGAAEIHQSALTLTHYCHGIAKECG